MKITYYGHSCFVLESDGFKIAVDPYDPAMIPGCADLSIEANKVYCSHGHMDHAFTAAVKLVPQDRPSSFVVTEVEVPHDDAGGSKRGFNFIRIFRAEGKKIIHFGDTGCMPDEETLELLKDADAVLMPVGGFFTIGPEQAKELADRIKPAAVVPMHYRKGEAGLRQIAELSEFTGLCSGASYEVYPLETGDYYIV